MVFLPLAVLAVLWLLVATHREDLGLTDLSVRGTFVIAFVLLEAVVTLITESTSVGHHLTTGYVTIAWGAVLLVLGALAAPGARRRLPADPTAAVRTRIAKGLGALRWEAAVWLTALVGVLGVLVATGWLYPPNNGDSMVYHLARVEHWIQNRSVSSYATHYLAQIELSPLHEFNMTHLHLLSGGDRLDGYVQLLALTVCVVGVSEVARLLHGSTFVQVVAAVVCVTIPSAILEGTSTQNNVFAAAIGIALIVIVLVWNDDGWLAGSVLIGMAAALAVLAKGTLPATLGPAAIVLASVAVHTVLRGTDRKRALVRVLSAGATISLVASLIAGPFLVRNVVLFGGPTGPVSRSTVSTSLTPRAAAANVLRDAAGNFRIGNGRSGFENDVSRGVLGPLGALFSHLGVAPGDSRYSLGTDFRAFTAQNFELEVRLEEYGANPWHVLLIVATIVSLAIGVLRGRRERWKEALLASGLILGYLLFTGTARWSVFAVRYQVPLLVAWCPLIGLGLGRVHRAVGRLVLIALLIACLPQLLDNGERSILHPTYEFTSDLEPYFPYGGGLGPVRPAVADYEAATELIAISTCHRVGLANWVLVEYPLWVGLRHRHWQGRIEDVDVENVSRTLQPPGFHPCASIRQEPPTYIAPDDGMVNATFGQLAISIEPAQVDAADASVPGFTSDVSGVRVLPGGGWTLASTDRPGAVLRGGGSIYVYSDGTRQVQLQFEEAPGGDDASLIVSDDAHRVLRIRRVGQLVDVTVNLRAGVNVVRLTARVAPTSADGPLHIQNLTAVAP